MTQEDKELLLKDLSARLPYGVIVRHADYLIDSDGNHTGQFWYKRGYLYNICRLDNMTTTIIESEGSDEEGYEHICDLERSLPYLRPMSSMTEEEKKEYDSFLFDNLEREDVIGYGDKALGIDVIMRYRSWEVIQWLLEHHFDFNDSINLGIALEAPKDLYKK